MRRKLVLWVCDFCLFTGELLEPWRGSERPLNFRMQRLDLSNNSLTVSAKLIRNQLQVLLPQGQLDSEFFSDRFSNLLSGLSELRLSNNPGLDGPLPPLNFITNGYDLVVNQPHLSIFDLRNTGISGAIPDNYEQFPFLSQLLFSGTRLRSETLPSFLRPDPNGGCVSRPSRVRVV